METTREKPKQKHMLHCPKCWKIRPHTRKVHGGEEIYTCQKCGNTQCYTLHEGNEEGEE